MTTQVTVIQQICQTLDKMVDSFADNLQSTGISTQRFISTAKTAIQTHADRDKLERADRKSLYLAIQKAAGDGLMPDNREAALVVYGSVVQYQPMVQGLVKLARQSGEIESINSEVVYENDEFELYFDFDGTKFKHKPNWKCERGKPMLVWASVKLKSGEIIARAYPKKRIDQIASRSKMSGNYDPEKGKDWEEFWRKAAIRNILKYAPKSTVLEKAMASIDEEFVENNTIEHVEEQPQPEQNKETPRRTKAEEIVTGNVIDAEVIIEEFKEEIPV